MLDVHPLTPPLMLTANLPGVGGRIKARPDDFLVDELPLTEPCGAGEHLWLTIEKRAQTTTDVARRIAKIFRVKPWHVSYAGLKDKYAVTRQVFSVHLPDASQDDRLLARFEFTPFILRDVRRHTRKLRRGHLAGNHFDIRIRDLDPTAALAPAQRILDQLIQRGMPNYFGPQRFGYRLVNHELGRLLILRRYQELLDLLLGDPRPTDVPPGQEARQAYEQGDFGRALHLWPTALPFDRQALEALVHGRSPEQAVRAIDSRQRLFLVSAFQSAVFNLVLRRRVQAGAFDRLLPGDLAMKHDSRGVFPVDQPTADLENAPEGRIPNQQISPTGPMWAADMIQPAGQVLAAEIAAMSELGLTPDDWSTLDVTSRNAMVQGVEGERRPLRVPLGNPRLTADHDEHGPCLRLEVDLPRGSFATVLLDEIIKSSPDPSDPQLSDQQE